MRACVSARRFLSRVCVRERASERVSLAEEGTATQAEDVLRL